MVTHTCERDLTPLGRSRQCVESSSGKEQPIGLFVPRRTLIKNRRRWQVGHRRAFGKRLLGRGHSVIGISQVEILRCEVPVLYETRKGPALRSAGAQPGGMREVTDPGSHDIQRVFAFWR